MSSEQIEFLRGHCYCGHKFFDHEIGMNTQQRGFCTKCDCRCIERPDEDALWDEIEMLRSRPASDDVARLRKALERLRDCDWVITPHDRMDAVRQIAREALAQQALTPEPYVSSNYDGYAMPEDVGDDK